MKKVINKKVAKKTKAELHVDRIVTRRLKELQTIKMLVRSYEHKGLQDKHSDIKKLTHEDDYVYGLLCERQAVLTRDWYMLT
jgi:hypothetical protein